MDIVPETLAKGRHLQLLSIKGWEYAQRTKVKEVVAIVASTADGLLIFVEQYRLPIGAVAIELPAGLVGDIEGQENEPLVEAARRELLEETGYAAEEMTCLATCPTSAGLTSEEITFVRASGLERRGPGGGDGNEKITVHEIPAAEVDAWLDMRAAGGTKVAATVYAGLYLARNSFAHLRIK